MMVRSEKSCRFWNSRPTGRYSNMCCPFVYFNTDILGLLAQKPSTARIMGGDPKFKASFSCQLQKAYCYLMLMVLVHGPKLRRFWKLIVFKWIISRKNMLPQFVKCPRDCRASVEHRPLTDHWFRLEMVEVLASQGSFQKALVTWWPTPQNWKLEQRVWQWMWRRTKLRGNNSEKLAAMSKLFSGWSSFWDVKKPACKAAYAIPMGNSRTHP